MCLKTDIESNYYQSKEEVKMNKSRRQLALDVRLSAAQMAASIDHPAHTTNGDEQKFRYDQSKKFAPNYLASYTKGLPHDYDTGLISNPDDFQQFVKGIDSGDPRDFRDTPLGVPENCSGIYCLPKWKSAKALSLPKGKNADKKADVRAWESAGAGQTFDLEGPDAQAVTMPPAPALGSTELTAEMGEVYVQALLRDTPFTAMALGTTPTKSDSAKVKKHINQLNKLDWFSGAEIAVNAVESSRRRINLKSHTAFRGITPGDNIGPYISQFLLAGNAGINGNDAERDASDGLISYGAITADQRVRHASKGDNHMTEWDEWFDVQNGANLAGQESYDNNTKRRFITTPRDMATYVHYDALYESYLNACLILLGDGIPFDPGIPFQLPDNLDHQQGFAHFGGPHILTLVTEVATRALKAVRYQKFNIHRRLRPEALAARLHKAKKLKSSAPELAEMLSDLKNSGIISDIEAMNQDHNPSKEATRLLPMAFCEGSPMHPSYGAGHATVAGACVTILKAFFDHKHPLAMAGDPGKAFVPDAKGQCLEVIDVLMPNPDITSTKTEIPGVLTVEGELNKLASNISIGRDWAGVHYFTDYIESLRMGEKIALGILQEQKLTYGENFSMTLPLFDGGAIRI